MPAVTLDNNSGLEQANLHTLNFRSLVNKDEKSLSTLLSACENHGFFYLDLRDWESGSMLKNYESSGQIMKQWFNQPLEEKLRTETISDAHGYKPPGVQSGVNENTRDGFEALRISRVHLLNHSHLPGVVAENFDLFKTFQLSAHFVLKTLLTRLSDAVGLEGKERFEDDALQDKTARGHNAHTDVGSFTLLFNEQPGLQVVSPTTNDWEYVAPKPGHAIINVADTLRFMSKRRFRSAMHRVLPHGNKMSQDRYSTAYFLRAGDSVVFQGINGQSVTAEEWFLSKYQSFNKTLQEQRLDSVATGGMERDLGVAI
ncbi:2og-fe oxygenase family protein [Colletotrichum chrysophilum]|uniref:2og-fe oxygenase family protein n=1 Tax=Colletotrichum chrysophilum TaxID=1836956 RepID=A0AAD9ENK6_9PEZI|nr:2og-fe oxygenase family protein [Colletotrichum chrysophilum]